MKTIYWTLTLLLGFSIAACKHVPLKKPIGSIDTTGNGGNNPKPCSPDSVYFNRDILPLLSSNCAASGCHDAGSAQDGVILTDYQKIMGTGKIKPGDPFDSDLFQVITET